METSVCDDGSNFQQLLLDRFAERIRKQVGSLLNRVLELEQMLHLGCCPYERTTTRRGHRNGYDARWLETRWGPVRVKVPKVRGTQEPFRPRALVRYGRREAALGKAIELWAASGMSTRKVARAVHETFGCLLSATAVSRILARVDEEVAAFHRRQWPRGYRYLYLDGKHGSVLEPGRRGLRKRPGTLLVAWGVDHRNNRELVDFRVARGEDAASWTSFLTDLERRGVRAQNRWGERLEMIVTDGAGGIASALDTVYPGVPRSARGGRVPQGPGDRPASAGSLESRRDPEGGGPHLLGCRERAPGAGPIQTMGPALAGDRAGGGGVLPRGLRRDVALPHGAPHIPSRTQDQQPDRAPHRGARTQVRFRVRLRQRTELGPDHVHRVETPQTRRLPQILKKPFYEPVAL